MIKSNQIILFFLLLLFSCKEKEKVDLIVQNAVIYTVDSNFSTKQALAIQNKRFVATGTNEEILSNYSSDKIINANGKYIYPGFIDAHCHFYGYGISLSEVALEGTTSFSEVVKKVIEHHQKYPSAWIVGRGWDQNDWESKQFPSKDTLEKLFPNTPLFLKRIDGHAALVNSAAIKLAGITTSTKVEGGEIFIRNGNLTGILVDNAMDLVSEAIPSLTIKEKISALLDAQKKCLAVGLTTVDDAGLNKDIVDLMDSLQTLNILKIRVYAMLNPTESNMSNYFTNGKYQTDKLNVRSFKVYADGALGSRGACLLEPYTDQEKHYGYMLNPVGYYNDLANKLYEHGFQMNTHCIGDSANRLLLNVYGKVLKNNNDLRWRIEHAQVIHPDNFILFKNYSIIPSVQPTHATSDMYWADERLGNERIKGAYANYDLLSQNNTLALGSDFPVEDINPLLGFYAAVVRKDKRGFPENGFQKENKLTREQALRGMTIWAAFANFEENLKGSIETDKFADFVILEEDIMNLEEIKLPGVKVLATYIDGEKVN